MNAGIGRRTFLLLTGATICGGKGVAAEIPAPETSANPSATAYEELMSEHSILRRVLFIYVRTAEMLERETARIPNKALGSAASLFRRYGEEFHEAVLEEQHVFPAVRRLAPEVREMPDVLAAQHVAGRAITNHVIDLSARRTIPPAHARPLAMLLRDFVWMYQNHAAREDTVLFPAWKRLLGNEYSDASSAFDSKARQYFGADGFRDAVHTLEALEAEFDLENLAAFTAHPPQR